MAPTTSRIRLVAVVVTYNRLEKLVVTLERLLQTSSHDLSAIVVIDNASTDGTQSWLNGQTDSRLHIVRRASNGGGSAGFSDGMKIAFETYDPDWIVVMDDDGRPCEGALSHFHERDLSGWDGLAAAVYFPSGEICEMNRPSRNPFWRLPEFAKTLFGGGRRGFHLGSDDYDGNEILQIDVTSFVGFFISRRGIALAGFPDPGLFIYGDDGLYTLGLSKAGGRIGFDPGLRFEHDLSTFAGQRGRFLPLWKVYYYHRNLLMLYREAAGWLFWPVLIFVIPKWISKVRAHAGERRIFLKLLWRAIWDGLLRRTSVDHAEVLDWSKTD